MSSVAMVLFGHQRGNGSFELIYGIVGLTIVAAWTLWERRYRRVWQDFRSRGWRRTEGQFDEGEVITMRKARSKTIAGYEVWFGYDYEGNQGGLYRLPRKTKEEAENAMRQLANKRIIVRVSPRKASLSHVSDEDLSSLPALND